MVEVATEERKAPKIEAAILAYGEPDDDGFCVVRLRVEAVSISHSKSARYGSGASKDDWMNVRLVPEGRWPVKVRVKADSIESPKGIGDVGEEVLLVIEDLLTCHILGQQRGKTPSKLTQKSSR